jgi:hypothetical protein
MMDLLGLNQHKPDLNGALLRRSDRNPIIRYKKLQRRAQADSNQAFWIDLDVPDNWVKASWLEKYLSRVPENSFITAHVPYSKALSDLFKINQFHHIFIYRDPRDVAVSYINFQAKRKDYPFNEDFINSPPEEQVQYVLSGLRRGDIVLAPLSERIQRAKNWIYDEQTLAIRFEDLIGEAGSGDADKQVATVRRVLSWCKINMASDEVDHLARNIFYENSETFHKGSIGQWKEFFNDDMYKLYIDSCGKLTEELGYS